MKKIVLILSILTLSMLNAYATVSTTEGNGYNEPILDTSLNFDARLDGGKVYTSWSSYSKDEDFVYYKIIRSQDNVNPVYPDNGYIYYTTDKTINKYTDTTPFAGTNYYRVCAITSLKNRYCSNVVKINKEKPVEVKVGGDKDAHGCYTSAGYSWCDVTSKCIRTWEEKCEKTEDIKNCSQESYSPVCAEVQVQCIKSPCDPVKRTYSNKCVLELNKNAKYLYDGACKDSTNTNLDNKPQDNTIRQKAEKLVNSFIEKIEKTYSSTDKRIAIINVVIDKLNALEISKPSQKQLIEFIITKFKTKIDSYKGNDLGDIESIFNGIQ